MTVFLRLIARNKTSIAVVVVVDFSFFLLHFAVCPDRDREAQKLFGLS